MAAGSDIVVLEQTRILPAPGAGEISLPLSYFDIPWLQVHPIHQLCFYKFPGLSKSHFTQTIVPSLKHSLSVTLRHFLPLAGNMIVFPYPDESNAVPRKPEIRYAEGDSVYLVTAECTKDFDHLTGHHTRKSHEFYPLVPELGKITRDLDVLKVPLLAVQVTLFSNHGVCLGITSHHAACDGNARVSFMRTWASITKFGNDKSFLEGNSLPFFDKSVIKDPGNLEEILWSHIGKTRVQESQPPHISGNADRVRTSFTMSRDQINKLKKLAVARRPTLPNVSSFIIVSALVWRCMAKLREALQNESDERELFGCLGDCRSRLDPPIPADYFGNCVVGCIANAKRNELIDEEGFVTAVELIGEAIRDRFSSIENINAGSFLWIRDSSLVPPTVLSVAGSPKFNIYDTDFGWGKPEKCEIVSTDYSGSMSLSACRESKDDIEIGISLPQSEMYILETIFSSELNCLLSENQ